MKTKKIDRSKRLLKPSDFATVSNINSIFQNAETEIVVQNIMKILSTTGNFWKELKWVEYVNERKKYNNFSGDERYYFDKAINYTLSPHMAKQFCPNWKRVVENKS